MTYCYNPLWKILVDRNLSKTEMRKQTGISTNMLAKMGKEKPVSMETLARICLFLNCGIDDIVRIISDEESNAVEQFPEISNATLRNWTKLHTHSVGRLEKRANKRASKRRVLPVEYFSNTDNIPFVQSLLDIIDENGYYISSVALSLGLNLLERAELTQKKHVVVSLEEYSDIPIIDELICAKLPDDENDILGLVYQCYLQEGKKNIIGSYYTPKKIADNMTSRFDFSKKQRFLDPCCGSGAFLLALKASDPNQLFGIDNDRTAVLIAKINLLLKYRNCTFIPQIYCCDFLKNDTISQENILSIKFDYIATNPPWGAMAENVDITEISSKETFSYFFVNSFKQLKKGGTIRFLFPEAILNVKLHKDIRHFILEKAGLVSITLYNDMFSGVTTKYVDIECGNYANKNCFIVNTANEKKQVKLQTVYETDNLVFNFLNDIDVSIIQAIRNRGKYSLQDSIWALGIVTGDNKSKISASRQNGMERIYTGKEIQPYTLKPARNYILYDRTQLQQVAKDEIYRAPEKLVYKFISNKLIFAYDNSGSLFLNSANILIPNIPNMSVKTVIAFLNSSLFQFMYIKLFGEVKILKGNLMELPFPKISKDDNDALTAMVDDIINGDSSKREDVERYIFSLYGISETDISYIQSCI